ncbi:hypothetical protein MAV3388_16095 [Mycobacterium avium subsp. hominissuis 3388]|nr:hypothetical protein MAV3388_16095 [Mycobacterium avium subsp. hominissuis 3388]
MDDRASKVVHNRAVFTNEYQRLIKQRLVDKVQPACSAVVRDIALARFPFTTRERNAPVIMKGRQFLERQSLMTCLQSAFILRGQ